MAYDYVNDVEEQTISSFPIPSFINWRNYRAFSCSHATCIWKRMFISLHGRMNKFSWTNWFHYGIPDRANEPRMTNKIKMHMRIEKTYRNERKEKKLFGNNKNWIVENHEGRVLVLQLNVQFTFVWLLVVCLCEWVCFFWFLNVSVRHICPNEI